MKLTKIESIELLINLSFDKCDTWKMAICAATLLRLFVYGIVRICAPGMLAGYLNHFAGGNQTLSPSSKLASGFGFEHVNSLYIRISPNKVVF